MTDVSKKKLILVRSVFFGRLSPERALIRDGFARVPMATTALVRLRPNHYRVARQAFSEALAEDRVLAYERDYGGYHGYLAADVDDALQASERGILLTASPRMAAQLKARMADGVVAVLKNPGKGLDWYLRDLGDVEHHVIDTRSAAVSEPNRVYTEVKALLGMAD